MSERFNTFTTLIAKASRNIRKIKTEEMKEFGLKSPHVSCLYYLYKKDVLTAKELCDICDEDKGSISRSIEYLESMEYIVCNSKSVKRYKSPLFLTEKGKEIGKIVCQKVDKILIQASLGLSDENRKNFYESLSLICENLQKISDGYEV